jgi:hypothetical protein
MSDPKISPSIAAAALQLCISPETLNACLQNRDRIAELEKEVKELKAMVSFHKEMSFSLKNKINRVLDEHP